MKLIPRQRLLHFSGLLISVLVWLANSSNPPNGRTGAPFDGHCNGCHGGNNPNNYAGTVTVSGMPSTVVPNTVYPLTITMTTTGTGVPVRGGFQLVAVDGNNSNAGDLQVIAGQGTGTETSAGREYIEHRNPKNFSGSGSSISWDFNWQSPATAGLNTIKFYFIGNFCDGSGSGNDWMFNTNEVYAFQPPPAISASISNIVNAPCFGQAGGSATVTATGGNGVYTYHWNNNQTTETVTNVVAGTYTVTVTDSGGGTITASATIGQPASAVSATTQVSNVITCNNPAATILANATGGTPPYQYAWANGNTGNTNEVTAPGTYVVTVTDNNGCTKTASASVSQNLTAPVATASGGVQSCANNSATVSGVGSSSGANFSYLWTPPAGGSIISGANALTATVSGLGTYVLLVTNSTNGCTSTASATVTGPTPPVAIASGGVQSCSTGSATVSGAGSSSGANFTYLWTPPAGGSILSAANALTATVSGLGVYTLVVTNNANGCTASATATVTGSTALVATATGTTISCAIPSGTIAASTTTPNVTYQWQGPGGFTSTSQNPLVSTPGTYTVTISSTSGCVGTATAAVTGNFTVPNLSVAVTAADCIVPTCTATASSTTQNVTYAWGGGITSTSPTVTLPPGGPYTVTITGSNGCTTASAVAYAANNTPPTVTVTNSVINCNNLQTTLTATSNVPNSVYSWNGPYIISGANAPVVTVGQMGPYTVTVFNTLNGCSSTATGIVTEDITPPTAVIAPPANLNCVNPTVTLNATGSSQGAAFYAFWSGPGIVGGGTTLTPIVDQPGPYTVTITNQANGCTASASTTVNQSSQVVVSIGNVTNPGCFGSATGGATAVTTGGQGVYTYLWSNAGTTAQVTGLIAGTYTVSATDGEGCSSTASVSITQPTALVISATATAETGQGQNNGSATANPSGGTSPYTYLWSNAGTTQTIESLAPGAYTITVADANNCTAVQTVTVNSFNCQFNASIQAANVTCNGAGNGSATVILQNAANPIVYQWSNLAASQTVTNLVPGVYTVTVTDAANCIVVVSTTIIEPAPVSANATSTAVSAVGVNDGTATANPSGGVSPYMYLWSNSASTQAITGLGVGNYTVTVTDANGCTAVQSAFVSAFNCAVTPVVNTTNITCAGAGNGTATASLLGGTLPLSFNWSNAATTNPLTGLAPGTYTVTIVDANGCAGSAEGTVTEPAPLVAEIAAIHNVSCINEKTGSVDINVTGGGTTPYSFTYPGPGELLLGVGLYTITVTNSIGCTTLAEFSIVAIDTIAPTITCPANIAKCDDGNVTVFDLPNATDNCFVGSLQFELIQGKPSGTYIPVGVHEQVFRVTDQAGNSSTCSFTISIFQAPDIALVSIGYDTNGLSTGYINITPLGGALPFTFVWKRNGVFFSNSEDLSGLSAGSYMLTATDANGCVVTAAAFGILNVVGTTIPFSEAGISVAPNPADNWINIDFKSVNPVDLEIYNGVGQLVMHLNDRDTFNQIDLSALSGGVFHILVTDKNGQRYITRFVKI